MFLEKLIEKKVMNLTAVALYDTGMIRYLMTLV